MSDLVKDQQATWIQPFQGSQDGRGAWLALVAHYDGGGQKEKRIIKAEAVLENIFYNNERIFSFDAYSAKLLRAFCTLESTDNRRTASNQVKILLDNIKISTPEFAVIKGHVRSNHRSDLQAAISYISTEVAELFPQAVLGGTRQNRHRFVSEANSRLRHIQGLSHSNGVYTLYGVDVTDVNRRFTTHEMATLGVTGQRYVFDERARFRGQLPPTNGAPGRGGRGGRGRGGQGNGGRGNGGGRGGRDVGAVETDENRQDGGHGGEGERAAEGTGDRGSTNGRRFGAGAYAGADEGRGVSMVTCGPRRFVGKVEQGWLLNAESDGMMKGRNKMDTMADTCCAGANWTLMETIGVECSVNDFAGNQVGTQYVPVATCATLIREEKTGVETIVVGHQMLWFGSKLGKTLLNQNQIRHAGHVVRDDPTRQGEEGFGIWADGIFIPFSNQGTKIYFESRAPSHREIEQLPHVVLTRQETWDPKHVDLSQPGASPYEEAYGVAVADIGHVSSILEPTGIVRELASVSQLETSRHSGISAESLSRKWKIGLCAARNTLRVTTQQGIRTAVAPITRRYRVDNLALHQNRLNTQLYTDTLFSKTLWLSGNKCAQVFTDGGFTAVYPMTSKAHAGQALADFIDQVGVPDKLTADLAGEQTGGNTLFQKLSRYHRIGMHWAEKGTGKQNHKAEREIGLLKQRWRQRMQDRKIPTRLWDYGLVYEAGLLSRVARGHDGRSGIERLTGETPDISEWIDFEFFDMVWYHTNQKSDATEEQAHLGYWLGVAHRVGSDLCYWILTKSGKVVARTTVQHITKADQEREEIRQKMKEFQLIVAERLNDANFTDDSDGKPGYLEDVEVEEEEWRRRGLVPSDEEYGKMVQEAKPEADEMGNAYDEYVGAQIKMDFGGEEIIGTVVKRQKGLDGKPIGRRNKNPLFDTRTYEVKFPGGIIHEYTANVVAENPLCQDR